MSPSERLAIAHRVAGQAIGELVSMDNTMSAATAARLLAGAALATVRGAEGCERAAEVGYRLADAMVETP
jgi:hypothetical protein